MGEAIAENLISDVITAVIGVIVTFALLQYASRGLAGLLGASRDRRILIVLPRIQVAPGGTVGVYRTTGYSGPAVARSEFEAAVAVRDALASPLVRLLAPRRSADAAGKSRSAGVVEATVMSPMVATAKGVDPSAPTISSFDELPSEFAQRSLLLIGGPSYNVLTALAFKHAACQMKPEISAGGEWGVRVLAGPQSGQMFTGRDTGVPQELAVIQSFRLGPGDAPMVTVCAGTGDTATFAGVEFLLANWRKIRRHTRDQPYAVLLNVAADTGAARWMTAMCDGHPFVL
jgi:hypothetical protein